MVNIFGNFTFCLYIDNRIHKELLIMIILVFFTIHAIAAVAAVGPLFLAPWLSFQASKGGIGSRNFVRTIEMTDLFFNRAGWVLIISGLVIFDIIGWQEAVKPWFIACVLIFIIDTFIEQKIRDPAYKHLSEIDESDATWKSSAKRLQRGVLAQTASATLILILMLVH